MTSNPNPPIFSQEKAVYQQRFEESYDIKDPDYVAWIKINHPEVNTSSAESISSSQNSSTKILGSTESSETLSEILKLPEPKILRSYKL